MDAAHRKSPEPSIAPRKEDIVESIIFKASDVVVVTFKDVDLNFARKGTEGFCVDQSSYINGLYIPSLVHTKTHEAYTM